MSLHNGDPVSPTLHLALKALYGSELSREMNHLTSLIRKLALVSCGLEFLIQFRHNHVFPRFISNAASFACHGEHLSRLARRLPIRMLRAAIRDNRVRLAQIQWAVDNLWIRLYDVIQDDFYWNSIVVQKDALFDRSCQTATCRLR